MAAIGKRYGVVTASTSLLVLDRIEDYLRYGVEPKEPQLLAEYRRLADAAPKPAADPGREARLTALIGRWREFRDWHAASYPGIESLLLPMTESELSIWSSTGDKAWMQGRKEAEDLHQRARMWIERWPVEGAQTPSREAWEREAARLVFELEALRERREKLPQIAAAKPTAYSGLEAAMVDSASAMVNEAPSAEAPPPAAPSRPSAGAPTQTARALPPTANGDDLANGRTDERDAAVAGTRARIELAGWNPDTPYLEGIRGAPDPYRAYLSARERHGAMPAFFLDVADFLRSEVKQPRLALRVLSNLAELDVENTALVRVLGYRLAQWDLYALAVPQFESALAQRPEEPQSWRDLALALARRPHPDRARAIELLWQVATRDWHGRFPDIELIALHELNDVLTQAARGEKLGLDRLGIPAELLDPVAVGLRVVLSWDADNTDIDLWVVDPSGDKAIYSQPRTRTGGHMSRDFTGGYGPEVYSIRRPLPGTYVVMANYFGDRRQSLTGPVTVQLEFQTRFGTRHSERAGTTRRLESGSQTIEIGRFKVGAPDQ